VRIRDLVYGSILTALALIIPIAFGGYLRVYLPPFSATLTSHVPVLLAMLAGPAVAAMVGVGSALGFLLVLGPVVAARAAVHMLVGAIGAMLVQQGRSFRFALLFTAPLHSVFEALVVLPFGFTSYEALIIVGVGTFLHHLVDATIALAVVASLKVSGLIKARGPLPH
jgi:niacin transporter